MDPYVPEEVAMKVKRIVVGVDFREPSVAAARWTAREFAPGAEIVLLHVVDVPRPPRILRGALAPADRVAEVAVTGARARLAELGPWVDEDRVVPEVVVGRASDRLIEAADLHGADLLVVGEHARRRGMWEWLGTTAEKVVRDAAVPVLVARGMPVGPPGRIVAAVDHSSGGLRALRWAAFLGRHLGARVVAVHALEPAVHATVEVTAGLPAAVMPATEMTDDVRIETERWLTEEAREAGVYRDLADCQVTIGGAVDQILAAIERERADLVVLGSRGAPSPVGTFLGGVARSVLRRARGPVLLVGPLGR